MPKSVYSRSERRRSAQVTPAVAASILARLRVASQQTVAREFGIAQATVSRLVRRAKSDGAFK